MYTSSGAIVHHTFNITFLKHEVLVSLSPLQSLWSNIHNSTQKKLKQINKMAHVPKH